ncbi:MAG: HlyD family secretion protein, partial [Paracoccaceae bacterium]
MRFLRRSLVGIFLFSLTVGLLAWAGSTFYSAVQIRLEQENRDRPARERVLAANVVTVELRTIVPILTSFGEVRSRRTLDLRATAGGKIVELAEGFEEGGSVTAGQLLVRIDPSDALAALVLSQADLQEAEAELRDADRGLGLAQDELMSAEDQVRLRERALARQENLLNRGVVTEAAVENAELAVSSVKQAVLSRRQALGNAQARVDQAKIALTRRQINLSEADRSLAETEIFAGFSGTLAEVSVVQGGLVTNNERLAQIVDAQALEVTFRVSTQQYARLLD